MRLIAGHRPFLSTLTGKLTNYLSGEQIRAAVARGLGFSHAKVAEFSCVSESTVKRWQSTPEYDSLVSVVAECNAIFRSTATQETLADATKSAAERVASLFDRAFKLTEKLIAKAEQDGDSATIEDLMEIHKNITVWAAKHVVSEAPKRMQIESTNKHEHVHVFSLAEAENLLATKNELARVQPKALIAEAIVIDTVADA